MTAGAHPIVVGVSGWPDSSAALAYAAHGAKIGHSAVVLVHAWDLPSDDHPPMRSAADLEFAAAALLQEAADRLSSMAPNVDVASRLVRGPADTALIEASRQAAVVVLGRHAGTQARLGPLAEHVAARAHCPVVTVPAPVRQPDAAAPWSAWTLPPTPTKSPATRTTRPTAGAQA
jgi:nucleotide-binding universal stress UspA family protein